MTSFYCYLYYNNTKIKNENNKNKKNKKEKDIVKFFTKELINYSKYSLQNLSLTQLPKIFYKYIFVKSPYL